MSTLPSVHLISIIYLLFARCIRTFIINAVLPSIAFTLNSMFPSVLSHHLLLLRYRTAGNFDGKNIWRIALIVAFGGFYFGGWVTLYHNYIH